MIKFTAPLLRNQLFKKICYLQGQNHTKQQQGFIDSLRDSYESLADNLQSEESVLNLFKSEQNTGPKASEGQVMAEYMNIMNQSYAKYYNSLSPEEQLKRSKDLIRSEVLQHDWDTFAKINKDYQDYSLFNKNFLSIKYNNENIDEHKADLSFLGDLDADVKQRVEKENVYSFIYQNPAGKKGTVDTSLVQNFERTEFDSNDLDWDERECNEADQRRWAVQEGHFQENNNEPAPRLSFKAKFELFTLFNEGQSVRDLSLRYGIMPYRVKAIVYQKRYFFDEVLPHLPFSYLRDLIAIEHTFEQHYGAVSYGVDLEEMKKAEQGFLFTNFLTPHRDVDISKLSEKEQERLKKFFEKKKQKKQDIVVDKFIGQGNKGYYLKSWILHKTRSRHSVTRMFEKIIKDSDKPYKLPVTVQTRLKNGPRIAGMKFGHK